MKLYKYLLLLCVISCQAQSSFQYQSIPKEYDSLYKGTIQKRSDVLKTFKNPFHIASILPRNYDQSGKVDYTIYFQKALLQYREVIFPKGRFLINKAGLTVPSNTKVYFEENAVLQLERNNLIRYEIFRIHDVQNVQIYYANIIGDRNIHLGTDGEWGFGISIQDSKNILLHKPMVRDCWGDGIFIGSEGRILSEDIVVEGGLVDNNRRNGLSVTSAKNLSVSNLVAANSNGTFPKAGIDFEPSHNWEFMENINVNNIVTFNNEEDGLLIVLVRLKSNEIKKVSMNINKHIDIYSRYGMGFMLEEKGIIGKLPAGIIDIANVTYMNNRAGDIRNYSITPDNNIQINIGEINSNNNSGSFINNNVKPNNFKINIK